MPTTNTPTHYGSVTKTLHWLTVILMLMLFPSGYVAHGMPFETPEQLTDKAWLFQIHKTLGITVFFLAVLRILWALTQKKPRALHPERRMETFAAETAHWVLYVCIILVPLTGWIHHAATEGFAPILWPLGQSLPFVPKSESVAALFSTLHFYLMLLLGLTILAHVAGALKHLVIDRDKTLQRMLPGQPVVGDLSDHKTSQLPMIVGLVAVIAFGGYATLQQVNHGAEHRQSQQTVAERAPAGGNWQVVDGTLLITVSQFGSAVSGEFATWQAEINFDDTIDTGPAGSVTVDIDVTSLSLGSVTEQALGTDYFNTAEFPTAQFRADITSAPETYEAVGTLNLRGVEQPVSLPFELTIEGNTAHVAGTLTLERLDFGIGANMPDESTLGFGVDVRVDLEAKRAE